MKTITRSLRSTKLTDVMEWVAQYELNDRYPQKNPINRFAIAIYQIYQGINWDKGPNAHESYMTCIIHLMLVCGLMKLPIESWLPDDFTEERTWPLDYKALLYSISGAQQMIWYYAKQKQMQRGSRYNQEQLCVDLSSSIILLLGAIPSGKRLEAIENSTTIMTGRL